MATWRNLLTESFQKNGEVFADCEGCTLTEAELDAEFDDGWGSSEGKRFTAWGQKYVYFPVVYDGSESIGYAPRNPCDEAMLHWGGE